MPIQTKKKEPQMKILLQSKMISEAGLQLHPERSNFYIMGGKLAAMLRCCVHGKYYKLYQARSLSINGSQLTEDW